MNKHFGLWIDHRKAVIATASSEDGEVKEILSHADRQPGRQDGVRSGEKHESLQTPADDVLDRKFQQQLNTYYDEIIASVQHAESLLIFGPGEAKGEFRKRLEKKNPGARTVRMETVDKMTDRQIAARVREYFMPGQPAIPR